MIFYILFSSYLILFIKYRSQKVIAALLLLQVASLASVILLNGNDFGDNPISWFNAIFMFVMNLFVILPWRNYDRLEGIDKYNLKKINKLSKVLIVLSSLSFVVLGVTAFFVQTLVQDVNAFKYMEGESTYFYTHVLPFDARIFMLFVYLYPLSYFLLFFHFFYLSIGKTKRCIWCLLGSLNIILYGLAMFSRWTLTLYVSLYLIMVLIFYPLISESIIRKMKKYVLIIVAGIAFVFITTTIMRFENNKGFEERIDSKSYVQNPVLYSVFDYLGQNNTACIEVLNNYDGTTFCGILSFKEVKGFLEAFRLLPRSDGWSKREAFLREKYFKDRKGGFIGWAAYTVYDFGYIGAFLIGILFFNFLKIKSKIISLEKLLVASFFIQIPICAIYYSWLHTVLLCLFMWLLMKCYLKICK